MLVTEGVDVPFRSCEKMRKAWPRIILVFYRAIQQKQINLNIMKRATHDYFDLDTCQVAPPNKCLLILFHKRLMQFF